MPQAHGTCRNTRTARGRDAVAYTDDEGPSDEARPLLVVVHRVPGPILGDVEHEVARLPFAIPIVTAH